MTNLNLNKNFKDSDYHEALKENNSPKLEVKELPRSKSALDTEVEKKQYSRPRSAIDEDDGKSHNNNLSKYLDDNNDNASSPERRSSPERFEKSFVSKSHKP